MLEQDNVATDGLIYSTEANTTLAFVHLGQNGDRSFSFYRKPGADILLTFADVDTGLIEDTKIFHFGAVCLTDEPVRSACMQAAKYAREKGITVSFDPNWRPPLWQNDALAKQCILHAVALSDILKVSDVEMELLTGETDTGKGSLMLLAMGPSLVFVTLGVSGCYYRTHEACGHVPAYAANTVDTTGAGDAFTAAILYLISKHKRSLNSYSQGEITKMADFANAVGALCVQKRGAIPAMPILYQVEEFIICNKQ